MKALGAVLPWMVATAGVGGLIWLLLSREAAAGRWLLAAFLIGHGVVHLLFAAPGGTSGDGAWPFDMGRSWLPSLGVGQSSLRVVGWTLIGISVVGFAVAGLSTLGVLVPADWWSPAIVAASIASGCALVMFFDVQLVLGLGIDVALVLLAVSGSWRP